MKLRQACRSGLWVGGPTPVLFCQTLNCSPATKASRSLVCYGRSSPSAAGGSEKLLFCVFCVTPAVQCLPPIKLLAEDGAA